MLEPKTRNCNTWIEGNSCTSICFARICSYRNFFVKTYFMLMKSLNACSVNVQSWQHFFVQAESYYYFLNNWPRTNYKAMTKRLSHSISLTLPFVHLLHLKTIYIIVEWCSFLAFKLCSKSFDTSGNINVERFDLITWSLIFSLIGANAKQASNVCEVHPCW